LVGAELTATLLDINYTPLPPAIQTEITEVFEELFTEFEEIEQIIEFTFEEEFTITEEFQIEEEFEVVSLIEYKEPTLESFQTMKEPKMVEEFEEMPEEMVEEFEEFVEEKEEKPIMNKPMEMATNEEKKEEQPEEIAEESSSEEPTETAKAETESRTEQKEKIREAKADARLVKTLDKIDEKIKEVDKNLQAKNFDNRIIYTKNLAEYQQNDPIFTQQNEINSIRLEKQKLIREIEVLKNG
jgi:hypothetical protein